MTIDWTKPVQTRDGRKVRILCMDAPCSYRDNPQPIVGIIDGVSVPYSWGIDGSYHHNESEVDLVNVPPKKKKVLVEVRLFPGIACVYPLANVLAPDRPWPPGTEKILASFIVEMEYEELP